MLKVFISRQLSSIFLEIAILVKIARAASALELFILDSFSVNIMVGGVREDEV